LCSHHTDVERRETTRALGQRARMSLRGHELGHEPRRGASAQLPSLDALRGLPSESSGRLASGRDTVQLLSSHVSEPKKKERVSGSVSTFTTALLSTLESKSPDMSDEEIWTSAVMASLGVHGTLDMRVATFALETADLYRDVRSGLVEDTPDAGVDREQLEHLKRLNDASSDHSFERLTENFQRMAKETSVAQALGDSIGHAMACMFGMQRVLAFLATVDPATLDDEERARGVCLEADRVFDDAYTTVMPAAEEEEVDSDDGRASDRRAMEVGVDSGAPSWQQFAGVGVSFTVVQVIVSIQNEVFDRGLGWGWKFIWMFVVRVVLAEGTRQAARRFQSQQVTNQVTYVNAAPGSTVNMIMNSSVSNANNADEDEGEEGRAGRRALLGPSVRRLVLAATGNIFPNPFHSLAVLTAVHAYCSYCAHLAYHADEALHRVEGEAYVRGWQTRSDRAAVERHLDLFTWRKSWRMWSTTWSMQPSPTHAEVLVAQLMPDTSPHSRGLEMLIESKTCDLSFDPYEDAVGNRANDIAVRFTQCWRSARAVPMLDWQETALMKMYGIKATSLSDGEKSVIRKKADIYAYAMCAAGLNLVYTDVHTDVYGYDLLHSLSLDPTKTKSPGMTLYHQAERREGAIESAAKDGFSLLQVAVSAAERTRKLLSTPQTEDDIRRDKQSLILLFLMNKHREEDARAYGIKKATYNMLNLPFDSFLPGAGAPIDGGRFNKMYDELQTNDVGDYSPPDEPSDSAMRSRVQASLKRMVDDVMHDAYEGKFRKVTLGLKLDLLFNNRDNFEHPFQLQRAWRTFWMPLLDLLDHLARTADAVWGLVPQLALEGRLAEDYVANVANGPPWQRPLA
jgi:hypothetical protein